MRLVTWNCRVGGFRWKAKHVCALRPDVVVVQEVEQIDSVLLFTGSSQPTFRNRLVDPQYPRRSIGVFSYTATAVKPVDLDEPMHPFRRFEVTHGDRSFNLVATWTSATKPSRNSYRQAIEGLNRYADWIRERPTVMLGDLNTNASFRGHNWKDLSVLLNSLRMVSAYHRHFNEEPGQEKQPTHYFRGKEPSRFHLDYCFIPQEWTPNLRNVQVGQYAEWNKVSDHMPLIVDLEF